METESIPETSENLLANSDILTERLSYYHRDGLGSILGRSSLSSSPTVVKLTNNYNAYGINTRNSNVNLYPQIDGFAEWDNKTYSQNEFDYETQTNYYGSRYYEPTTGVWTQQDRYRGNTSTPMSRHRYMFVNDNPVNNKDLYGYLSWNDIGNAWNSGLNWVGDQISSLVAPQNYSYEVTVSYDNSAAINQLNSAKGQLQNNLSTLQQQSNSDWWSAHFASVEMNNYIGMTGIIGRLQRRGYDLDYGQVYNYLGNQAAYHQAIYNSKLNTYYNTLSLIDQAKAGIESYNSQISSTPNVISYSENKSIVNSNNNNIFANALSGLVNYTSYAAGSNIETFNQLTLGTFSGLLNQVDNRSFQEGRLFTQNSAIVAANMGMQVGNSLVRLGDFANNLIGTRNARDGGISGPGIAGGALIGGGIGFAVCSPAFATLIGIPVGAGCTGLGTLAGGIGGALLGNTVFRENIESAFRVLAVATSGVGKVISDASEKTSERLNSEISSNTNSDEWYKSTFKNSESSLEYHWNKHAKDLNLTKEQYTKNAVDFFNQNKASGSEVTLRDGTKGILIRSPEGPGGYFTLDGKPISFWYN